MHNGAGVRLSACLFAPSALPPAAWPPDALERLRRISLYDRLHAECCSEASVLDAVGWSRPTLFRWKKRLRELGVGGLAAGSRAPRARRAPQWTRAEQWAVWNKRLEYPFMGKARLRVMLARDQVRLSESTIGRILEKGVRLGHIRPCAFLRGRSAPKRRRDFSTGHAQRWKHGMKASKPGELVQIDHMTIHRDGQTLKEFKAIDPVGRQLVARVYSRATAGNAARSLLADLPHPLLSLQVDGGSEFMADFDAACRDLQLPLFVLPPRSPELNGSVERANSTTRTEFWSLFDGDLTVKEAAPALAEYQRFHNHTRPHMALDYLTPNEYLEQTLGIAA